MKRIKRIWNRIKDRLRFRETVAIEENVRVEKVHKETGEVVETVEAHNKTVQDGLDWLPDVVSGTDSRDIDYMAIGSDKTSTTTSMSSLQGTEHKREQIPASDISKPNSNEVEYFWKIKSNEPGGQPVDIGEVALFADQKGDANDFMFARVGLDSTFTKTSDFEVRIYYTLAFSNP